jgi:hypothetical protein
LATAKAAPVDRDPKSKSTEHLRDSYYITTTISTCARARPNESWLGIARVYDPGFGVVSSRVHAWIEQKVRDSRARDRALVHLQLARHFACHLDSHVNHPGRDTSGARCPGSPTWGVVRGARAERTARRGRSPRFASRKPQPAAIRSGLCATACWRCLRWARTIRVSRQRKLMCEEAR